VFADAVLLVIRHAKSNRVQVGAAARALVAVDAPLVGTVMNMRKQSRSERRTYGAEVYYGAQPTSTVAATALSNPPRDEVADQPLSSTDGISEDSGKETHDGGSGDGQGTSR
jgi:Mrp family chromosome partitioning ATPase